MKPAVIHTVIDSESVSATAPFSSQAGLASFRPQLDARTDAAITSHADGRTT